MSKNKTKIQNWTTKFSYSFGKPANCAILYIVAKMENNSSITSSKYVLCLAVYYSKFNICSLTVKSQKKSPYLPSLHSLS